jgi:hypothetical protein
MKPEPKVSVDFIALMQTLRPFGVPRLLADTLPQESPYDYVPIDQRPVFRSGMNQRARLATYRAETEQRERTMERVRAIPSLGSLPRR